MCDWKQSLPCSDFIHCSLLIPYTSSFTVGTFDSIDIKPFSFSLILIQITVSETIKICYHVSCPQITCIISSVQTKWWIIAAITRALQPSISDSTQISASHLVQSELQYRYISLSSLHHSSWSISLRDGYFLRTPAQASAPTLSQSFIIHINSCCISLHLLLGLLMPVLDALQIEAVYTYLQENCQIHLSYSSFLSHNTSVLKHIDYLLK